MTTTTYSPIRLGPLEVRYLLDAEDTGGNATVFETRVPTGAKVPAAHSHDGFEEMVYGLEGMLTFTIEGCVQEIRPGEAAFIERGQIHKFENLGDADAAFLSVATPGVFRPAYFHDVAAVIGAAAGGPPDMAALFAVMQRHGLTPAVPAPTVRA